METTKEQLKQGLDTIFAVSEAIRELGEVPSGSLFVGLSGRVTLEGYQKMLGILTNAGLIQVTPAHLIRWVGPLKGVKQ